MDIQVLEYFLVVSQEQNITHAAEILHLTQPTLSRQMRLLEERMNAVLFERTNHSIRLTDEGKLLRRRAQIIVETYRKAAEEVSLHREELNGTLYIGATESAGMDELACKINAFQASHKAVKFDIFSGQPEELKAGLMDETLDAALIPESDLTPDFSSRLLHCTDEWGVLVHKSLSIAGLSAVQAEDIIGTGKLIVLPHVKTPPHNDLMNWYGEWAAFSDFSAKYNTLNNAVIAACREESLVFCLRPYATYPDMHFIPLDPPMYSQPVVAWKKRRTRTKILERFLESISM